MFSTIFQDSSPSGRDEPEYTDVEVVAGLLADTKLQRWFYKRWTRYFQRHGYKFSTGLNDKQRDKLIHETFLHFWTKVESGHIRVADGSIVGADGKPFACSLLTYLMAVAKNQKHVILREEHTGLSIDDPSPAAAGESFFSLSSIGQANEISDAPYDEDDPEPGEIVRQMVNALPERCRQILTLYYYEGLTLDEIMLCLETYTSKDALKSKKKKCFDKLREMANMEYFRRHHR